MISPTTLNKEAILLSLAAEYKTCRTSMSLPFNILANTRAIEWDVYFSIPVAIIDFASWRRTKSWVRYSVVWAGSRSSPDSLLPFLIPSSKISAYLPSRTTHACIYESLISVFRASISLLAQDVCHDESLNALMCHLRRLGTSISGTKIGLEQVEWCKDISHFVLIRFFQIRTSRSGTSVVHPIQNLFFTQTFGALDNNGSSRGVSN